MRLLSLSIVALVFLPAIACQESSGPVVAEDDRLDDTGINVLRDFAVMRSEGGAPVETFTNLATAFCSAGDVFSDIQVDVDLRYLELDMEIPATVEDTEVSGLAISISNKSETVMEDIPLALTHELRDGRSHWMASATFPRVECSGPFDMVLVKFRTDGPAVAIGKGAVTAISSQE